MEQIVVRIFFVVVDAFLDLEDVDREDACLTVSEACIQCQQDVLDGHPALRSGVSTVVDG